MPLFLPKEATLPPAIHTYGRAYPVPDLGCRNSVLCFATWPLDLDWVHEARFTNRSAAERRAATLPARRTVKKAWQAAWLLRAVTCLDLTTLYDEVCAFRETCGDAHMKTIIASGELGTLRNVRAASLVCMMAGADFVKTSTGKEPTNATLPVSLVMLRAARDYFERTGVRVGFKPAGGIRTARQSLDWLALMKEELGDEWLRPSLFRIGASGLLTDIERQLWHSATGRYSAAHHHPMP